MLAPCLQRVSSVWIQVENLFWIFSLFLQDLACDPHLDVDDVLSHVGFTSSPLCQDDKAALGSQQVFQEEPPGSEVQHLHSLTHRPGSSRTLKA